jgi:putative intracellular protease/amidase
VKATKSIKDITDGELAKYDAIFIPGGHGIV